MADNKEPLVSVVIPTYNRAHCIETAVRSVLNQTHESIEIIVVDDGSTDNTSAVVASLSDERIRYLHQENGGVSAARNTGLQEARGDYIALLDSDDEWFPWKLELQLSFMRARPDVGMTWTNMTAVSPDGRVVDPRHLRNMYSAYQAFDGDSLFSEDLPLRDYAANAASYVGDARAYVGEIYSPMVVGNLVHTSTVVLTRDRARAVGLFDESYRNAGEDYEFHLRTCREGPVALLDTPTIRYLVGADDQITAPALSVKIARSYLRTLDEVVQRDRARIDLPESQIRKARAAGHRWLAEKLAQVPDVPSARHHMWKSLTLWPSQLKLWVYLPLLLLPGLVRGSLLVLYRSGKEVLSSSREGPAAS